MAILYFLFFMIKHKNIPLPISPLHVCPYMYYRTCHFLLPVQLYPLYFVQNLFSEEVPLVPDFEVLHFCYISPYRHCCHLNTQIKTKKLDHKEV